MMKKPALYITILIVALVMLSLFLGCIGQRKSIRVNGEKRTYLLHVPDSYDPTIATPLVLVLHGGGGNAKNIEDVTGFSEKADDEGFIVVYPDGTGKLPRKLLSWNGGFCCGYARDNNIDDVLFISTLIDQMKKDYNINDSRIYVTGISNGGVMTYRLGAELAEVFAAIAPVAAQIGGQATEQESIWRIPEPDNFVSVIAFNGMKDERVPYDGGPPINESAHVYSWMSVNESITFWIEQNQCHPGSNQTISESGNIIIDSYQQGTNDTEVRLVTIVDGNHSWPGGQKGWENGDEPTTEINATDMIWDFFSTHPKK